MAGFEGTWTVQEHKIKNGPIIVDEGKSEKINIDKVGDDLYKVHIPIKNGVPLEFTVPKNDRTLSYEGVHDGYHYGVRLVFDRAVDPQKIEEGALLSVIERWRIHPIMQPEDMGTITGTKGL